MTVVEIIRGIKCESFEEALQFEIPILNFESQKIGKLVPVGNWILQARELIELMSIWRQRTMRMFMTHFESSYEMTYGYLKNLAIAKDDRIFFIIYNNEDAPIGHVGIANLTEKSAELDNLMRGVEGGEPRLVYFAECALLNWCFKELENQTNDVSVLSYNWLAIGLHEEVGYMHIGKEHLFKEKRGDFIVHEIVDVDATNVKYSLVKMLICCGDFYKTNSWIK